MNSMYVYKRLLEKARKASNNYCTARAEHDSHKAWQALKDLEIAENLASNLADMLGHGMEDLINQVVAEG